MIFSSSIGEDVRFMLCSQISDFMYSVYVLDISPIRRGNTAYSNIIKLYPSRRNSGRVCQRRLSQSNQSTRNQ
jgi:hypothetical protein